MRQKCAAALACGALASLNWSAAAIASDDTRSATAPTAALPPEAIDGIWARSVAKYDAARRQELRKIDDTIHSGPYRADWRSLVNYRVPAWYRDAKFGIFIHWGVFSVPAYGSEWYSRWMYKKGSDDYNHHVATYGPPDRFGYKDFIPMFRAEHYQPQEWADLFRSAGARYVVPVAEHHDGFSLYDSHLSDWTAVRMGPHRDLIGALAAAVRKDGLYFGLSSHLAEHDWFQGEGRQTVSDLNDPRYASLYGPAQQRLSGSDESEDMRDDFTPVSQGWLDEWLARSAELVDLYHPDLVWFDWWISQPSFRNTLPKFLAYYDNDMARAHREGVVNYKFKAFAPGSGVMDVERGTLADIQQEPWQICTSISEKSWGYVKGDTYKSPVSLLRTLVDVVAKNGNLLLNIGPRADGTIPDEARAILLKMGGWLHTNADAIYGTRPWRVFGEGAARARAGSFTEKDVIAYQASDFRFTQKGDTVFAIEMSRPTGGEVTVRSIRPADHVTSVQVLGTPGATGFRQIERGLVVTVPKDLPDEEMPVFAIRLGGEAAVK